MSVQRRSAAIWNRTLPADLEQRLTESLYPGEDRQAPMEIFFRADDIGIMDDNLGQLLRLFRHHRIPLCLAVVPAWMDERAWRQMAGYTPDDPLWCWHQHGWAHRNHQKSGRKSEFGSHRSREEIRDDLARGSNHLQTLLGSCFFPVFTPPWNRCSEQTLQVLSELDFTAVSRTPTARPEAKGIITDLPVNVDLHTRREQDPAEGWDNLWQELSMAAASGRIGIMIHHQLINGRGFRFLDILLTFCRHHPCLRLCTFRELLATLPT